MSHAPFLRLVQDQSHKLKENVRNGRPTQSGTSTGNGNKSLRSSSAADAEEERKAKERALKLSADALAKWRKKAKQVTHNAFADNKRSNARKASEKRC